MTNRSRYRFIALAFLTLLLLLGVDQVNVQPIFAHDQTQTFYVAPDGNDRPWMAIVTSGNCHLYDLSLNQFNPLLRL